MNSAFQFDINGSFKVQELEVKFKPSRKRPPVEVFSSKDVFKFLAPIYANEPREKLIVLSLAPTNGVMGMEVVAQGTSDSAPVSPREVFKAALLTNCSSIIVAHNHPSGKVDPSENDKLVFECLWKAALILQITLLDFIIIGRTTYHSFADSGELALWAAHKEKKGGD